MTKPKPIGRTIESPRAPTPRVLRAAAPFGLTFTRARAARTQPDLPAELRNLALGRTALINGPSGAGKTTLLRALRSHLGRAAVAVDASTLQANAPVADQFGTADPVRTLRALTSAGLGDATLLVRTPRELSDGERLRLALAVALARTDTDRAHGWLLIDEFCSNLDRRTAACLAGSIRKRARREGVRVVAACAHEDMADLLAPDVLVRTDDGCSDVSHRPVRTPHAVRRFPRISEGDINDYDQLARHHYRAGRPATVARVLRAHRAGELAGVLVASYPTLNASWRSAAWGERYVMADKALAAKRLNREVRCISRVVVAPRWRGLGVATRLVRAYLRDAETVRTEAVSAMGALSPFFERAGMCARGVSVRPHDERLLGALRAHGVRAWWLLDSARSERALRDHAGLVDELRRWARAGGAALSACRAADALSLARLAGVRLGGAACGVRPVAYTFG